MFLIKRTKENPIVTDFYLNIIQYALIKNKKEISSSRNWKELNYNKGDIYVVSTATEALYLILLRRPYMFWAQGVWPEESFMRNNSKIRFSITSFIEKLALEKAKFVFLVSKQMLLHYKEKYNLELSNKTYIMPCVNDRMHEECFSKKDYAKKTFCYAGGLSKWQCIEETLILYKKIEDKYPDASLLLLVKDKIKIMELLKKYEIKNYQIDFVSIESLPKRLENINFGFLLRQKDIVNTVATPTKLMTYLGNGIIPIYSNALEAVDDILKNTRYKVNYTNDENINDIEKIFKGKISFVDIKKDYIDIFNENFNKEKHSDGLSKILLNKI